MAMLTELQCLEGHDDRVWHLAWSPSGDALASCSGDRTVRLWARGHGGGPWRCTAVLEGTHTRTVRSCSWSPNGRLLITASFDRTVAVWEAQGDGNWEHVAVLEGHENEVKAAAWNPNGTLIATCGRDKTVWVWEAAPGHEYEVVDVKHGHSQDVKTVRWHPGGEVLVSASYDDSIKLWMESDDEWICVQTLSGPGAGHASTVWDVAFDSTGELLASCSDDCTLRVWRCEVKPGSTNCTPAVTLSGYHDRAIFSLDWSPEGYLATGSADNSMAVFSIRDGENGQAKGAMDARKEGAHPCDVNCVRWHPKEAGLLASAGDDGCIRLWQFTPAPA